MKARAERVGDVALLAQLAAPRDWPALRAEDVTRSAPDAAWVVRDGDALVARCSAWWTQAPPLDGERVGVIGHFAAASEENARLVLDAALAALDAAGVTLALGPMDGNTWRRYRFVTERGSEPPFLLEPWNPAEWPAWWRGAGWRPHAEYMSAANEDLGVVDPGAAEKAQAMAKRGVVIRMLDLARYDEELGRIYELARESFRASHLYTPLDEASFRAQYGPARAAVVPELVSIAEHEGRCVGFFFALPNVAEAQRGEPVRSAIAKTFAVRDEYRGLGAVLAQRTHDIARAAGFTRVIHALIHLRNDRSRALSSRTAREIRRYALLERRLRVR